MINDMLKALRCCGSFLVVDEEYSTVHFAHSSVKKHLLSEPTEGDVRAYHISSSQADDKMGHILVTYLNLDILSYQLSRRNEAPRLNTANVLPTVVGSVLPKQGLANKIALGLLKRSKIPKASSGHDLKFGYATSLPDVRPGVSDIKNSVQEVFSFLPYCQQYWLSHTKSLHRSATDDIYELWERLSGGTVGTVELPWAVDETKTDKLPRSDGSMSIEQRTMLSQKLSWARSNYHCALQNEIIESLCHALISGEKYLLGDFITIELQELLLPNQRWFAERFALRSKKVKSKVNTLLLEGAAQVSASAVLLALQEGADIETRSRGEDWNTALQLPILSSVNLMNSSNHRKVAEILIDHGADVNACSAGCGSVLQAAAMRRSNSFVKMVLDAGVCFRNSVSFRVLCRASYLRLNDYPLDKDMKSCPRLMHKIVKVTTP